jgi:hypothetical protein
MESLMFEDRCYCSKVPSSDLKRKDEHQKSYGSSIGVSINSAEPGSTLLKGTRLNSPDFLVFSRSSSHFSSFCFKFTASYSKKITSDNGVRNIQSLGQETTLDILSLTKIL